MTRPRPLPAHLGARFTVKQAWEAGVDAGRMRRADLATPFRGVRAKIHPEMDRAELDPYERQRAERRIRAYQYAPRLRPDQYLSHESAVALWGGPLPLTLLHGKPADGRSLPVHVTTLGAGPLVRAVGVHAHRDRGRTARVARPPGLALASPETAFVGLGHWNVIDLVALGDFFCRAWRMGHGRPDAGKQSFSTTERLREAVNAARRRGAPRLREAIELIREDSWSARESQLRCRIIWAGLPEPELNLDVYSDDGVFLACTDLAYPEWRVAIEYQSTLHAARYAQDVERIAALRAAGWTVIEVTSALFARPEEFIRRIRGAIAAAKSAR